MRRKSPPKPACPEWDIKTSNDLGKIPLFGEDKVDFSRIDTATAEKLRLNRRLTGLRRLGLIAGKEVTPLGRAFVAHCLSDYGEFKGKLSLSHSTDPLSYPEIGNMRKGRNEDFYYEDLGRANDEIRESVFENDSLLSDAPKIVRDAIDVEWRFGRYSAPVERNGRIRREWWANWDSYGGNGWGANDQDLVSDYDSDHFDSIINDWEAQDFRSAAEAFASVYYELWALYLWGRHYTQCTDPEELMWRWRWNLAGCYTSRCEEIWDFLHLTELRKQFITAHSDTATPLWFGPVTAPEEFAAESDANLEALEPYVTALEATIKTLHAEVAIGMRANGYVVVDQRGLFHCVLNNGAETTSKPFLDTVKALILDTYSGPPIHAPAVKAFRDRAFAALSAAPAERYFVLSGIDRPVKKGDNEDSKPS